MASGTLRPFSSHATARRGAPVTTPLVDGYTPKPLREGWVAATADAAAIISGIPLRPARFTRAMFTRPVTRQMPSSHQTHEFAEEDRF